MDGRQHAVPLEDTQQRAEHFIPFLRDDLITMCLEEGRLAEPDAGDFRAVCARLVDYLHCRFLRDIDAMKRHYAPFDPDRATRLRDRRAESLARSEEELTRIFKHLAERANYFPVTHAVIEESFEKETLIKLRTEVDLEDFERVHCFARGDVFKTVERRRFFRTRSHRVDILERVLLFLKYKDDEYFKRTGKKQRPEIQPGKIYLYFYKDVPKWDLELLFPNVRVGMRLKDKLMLAIPALGGGVGVLLKVLPQVVIIAGAILFVFGARSVAENLGVSADTAGHIMPVLTALLGVSMALGGLAFKQWTSYQKKRIAFLRDVSEQLFFRNLATNRAVFHRIIDSAEEEEGKEMMLVLYHLFKERENPFTRPDLDHAIEVWMQDHLDATVDFDIDGALGNLKEVRGTLPDGRALALLAEDEDGRLHVPSPRDARALLDTLAARRFGL